MKGKIDKNRNLVDLFKSDNATNIKGVRKYNFPYVFIWIFYYAWVIAFSTWWTASPFTKIVFETEIRSLMHFLNLISSVAFIFIIHKEWFIKSSRIGAVLVIMGMSIFMTTQNTYIQLISAIVIAISLGIVNAGILMPFVFTLNNTEKFYAVVGSNVLINFLSLFFISSMRNNLHEKIDHLLSFIILLIALGATLFFKKSILEDNSDGIIVNGMNSTQIHPRIYLTIFFSCIFAILCKGVGQAIINITAENFNSLVLMWYYIGGLAGCIVYLIVYAIFQKCIYLAWNIAFGCLAMGLFCNAFVQQIPELATVFAVLLGIGNTVGMINMYYVLGVIGKKYNSMRYLQLSILLIGICGGMAGVAVGNLINKIGTFEISITTSIISTAAVLLLLVLSPTLYQVLYEDDLAKDFKMVEIDNEQLHPFNKYKLSKREIEVCKLLLEGYTMRQISVILSIAYSTVNTYCTNLYRKLNINSRTELLLLFISAGHEG